MKKVILGVATANDASAWDQLKTITADMYDAGPVSIKFAYFGAEGNLSSRPCITTRWVTDPDDMDYLIDEARANCVCGCFVNVADIFDAALKEDEPPEAVIVIGDVFHSNRDTALASAEKLAAAGTRLFLFQQGRGDALAPKFRLLAERTGGAFIQYNPVVERVAGKLPRLLKAVAHFALSGTQGLEALEDQSADLLLEQLSANALTKPR